MSWITITEAQALAALSGAEQTALAAQNTRDAKADPVPAIITAVTRDARSAVRAYRGNSLGPDGTIPDEMLQAALAIIRYELLNQLPLAKTLLTQTRIDAKKDADAFFDKVAKGTRSIEQPPSNQVSPEVSPRAHGISLIHGYNERVNHHRLRGL